MADLIGAVAYVLTVWLFALHLIFDRRFRQRLRALAKQQHRLERRLAAMESQESWVDANSAFSHAPFALVCLSGQYYRVAARHLHRHQLEASRELLVEAAATVSDQSRRTYRHCKDLYGYFGDVGSFGSLKDLPPEGCRLLRLGHPVVLPTEADAVESESPLPVVDPEVIDPKVVFAGRVLPPLFSSRFH